MIDLELDQLNRSPGWRTVLDLYEAAQAEAKRRDPEHDGWVPRLGGVAGIDDARLPRIHGKLIALGLLNFQLAGRASGVVYRVSSIGRQALSGTFADPAQDADPSESTEAA